MGKEGGDRKVSKYIVFTSKEHYNPLDIVRTIGEAHVRPIVVAVKGDLKFVGQSKYVKEKYYVDSPEEGLELIKKKFPKVNGEKNYILTGDDVTVALLDRHYDELKDDFYFYNAGENGRITHFMNKDNMIELVKRHGIEIAKTWKVKNGEIPSDIAYPIMTKAINSIGDEWKDIVYICHDDKELEEAYRHIKSPEILLQQYIKKVDEVSFDAFSYNHGEDVEIVMEAYQYYNIPDKYSPYWIIKNPTNKEMGEKIKNVIREIRLEGIFEFEFIKDADGNLWFLEINFRNTALGYATTVARMPQVVLWCKAMNHGRLPKNFRKDIPEHFMAMAECFDYDVRVKGGIIPKKEWLKQYKNTPCKMYKGRNDNIPFYRFMWYKLTKMRH